MRTSFPVEFEAYFLGKSREAGKFEADDRTVEYPDAYDLGFESSDGLTQSCRVSLKALDEACEPGLDVTKLDRFTILYVIGDVSIGDGGGRFKPTKVSLTKRSVKAS